MPKKSKSKLVNTKSTIKGNVFEVVCHYFKVHMQFVMSIYNCGEPTYQQKSKFTLQSIIGMRALIVIVFICGAIAANTQNIYRFEHFDSKSGLSQNTVFSLFCDSKGFLWIGTWNGLNRYDGKEFKVFRSHHAGNNVFTSNRIIDIWEDKKGFIWMKTYDGYYHYFNPRKELFKTLPEYTGVIEERNSIASCFGQDTENRIWIGTTNSGAYSLAYNEIADEYTKEHIRNRGTNPLSNNKVHFIHTDQQKNLWIGTQMGLNRLKKNQQNESASEFQHLFANVSFSNAVCETPYEIWFGTQSSGLLVFDKTSQNINIKKIEGLEHQHPAINFIKHVDGTLFVSTAGQGVWAFTRNKWIKTKSHLNNIEDVYIDHDRQIWLSGKEYGLTKLDANTLEASFYQLTTHENKSIADMERQFFFEDAEKNLWVGLHGGGLAHFNRNRNSFDFYKNDRGDAKSLSSNVVLCIAQDKSGQLWLGTGLHSGGLEKAVMKNQAIEQTVPLESTHGLQDNVTRALFEDSNEVLWVATKSGRLVLYNHSSNKPFLTINLDSGPDKNFRSNNVYCISQDKWGYVWLGSKGEGIARSDRPVVKGTNYANLNFTWNVPYANDSTSFASRNVYSVIEDRTELIWIGTFGAGIFVTNPNQMPYTYKQINTLNSNLSSDQVRELWFDSDNNLWVATTFGINYLSSSNIKQGKYDFKTILHNPDTPNSLSYNDVVSIFEDSKKRLWFTTFGGGVNMLEVQHPDKPVFKIFTRNEGISNDVVFDALEDKQGNIWFSTDNGLTRLDPKTGTIEIFDENNGLGFSNFSENTAIVKKDGNLVFGGNLGFVTIAPLKLSDKRYESPLEFTNFYVANKKVEASQPNSPLVRSIDNTELVKLKHFQSGFSIEFAALDFQNPHQTQYAYRLLGFEDDWVYPGNNNRATYTNLKPKNYVFEVRWTNRDGQWSKNTKTLQITILPPWYATWWAICCYVIVLGIIVFFIFKVMSKMNDYKHDLLLEKKINHLKLQFFTNVSHEIRTPLTLIISPLEDLLTRKDLPKTIIDQLKLIKKNARRMLRLTNQLLDFRKVQNNKMVLNIREVDLVDFVRDIYQSFQPLAQHKHINYQFQSAIESCMVWIDPSKIDIVVYNLLSNALKFTEPGKHVWVSITAPENQNNILVTVRDEGRGIAEANLNDLFARYTILSNNDLSGTGIGLSLSYELAKLHGGDIKVESLLHSGSSFHFILQKGKEHFMAKDQINLLENTFSPSRKTIDEDELTDSDTEPSEDMIVNDGIDTILVVEDNHEILNYIVNSLQDQYTCIKADNGTDALKLAIMHQPSLIISDVMMPGMDGMELTRYLKNDFQTCHIPVVMLTAKSSLDDQLTGIETGAEAYITKPFQNNHLKAVIQNLLTQRKNIISKITQTKPLPAQTKEVNIQVNSKDQEFLNNLTTYIEQNFEKDVLIDQLAEHCCLSRTVFYTKLKSLTGLSPVEFVRQFKLKIAVTLLEKGYNVSEVAFKIGFNDVKYFSRQFKSLYGYPPSQHAKD
jgi:ligand-binding sensor domain-containing protein/DNA-binding response OmpR family regulator/nitrogen-specific signal transduction histidine kinase